MHVIEVESGLRSNQSFFSQLLIDFISCFSGRSSAHSRTGYPQREEPFLAGSYTLFQISHHLDIHLFLFKLDLDASFMAKYSFEC